MKPFSFFVAVFGFALFFVGGFAWGYFFGRIGFWEHQPRGRAERVGEP
jgi:hypothetical protein